MGIEEVDFLAPIYLDHIRKPTILGVLQSLLHSKKNTSSQSRKVSMIEHILDNSSLCTPGMAEEYQERLQEFVKTYGKDIVRTCAIFSQNTDAHHAVNESSVKYTKEWFGWIWDAVREAHESYNDTQASSSSGLPHPERTNPDLTNDLVRADIDSTKSLVHVPPFIPDMSDPALWLAAQEAIVAMTSKSDSLDPHLSRSKFTALIFSIRELSVTRSYGCSTHYRSARILLTLIAPLAPSFAEECWVALHYGHPQWRSCDTSARLENEEEDFYSEEYSYEELVEFGYQDLPKRNDPGTLSSIFAQPPLEPESAETMRMLKEELKGAMLPG